MKKYILAFAVASLTSLWALAVPAKRITRTVVQPDGQTLTLTLAGDEFAHAFVTSDGLAVEIDAEGHAVYRSEDPSMKVYAHEPAARAAAEVEFVSRNMAAINLSAMQAASRAARGVSAPQMRAPITRNEDGTISLAEEEPSQVPHVGSPNIPIILANYTDIKFKDGDNAHAVFDEFFNSEESLSCLKYFKDQSLGQYTPVFHVIGPVNLSRNRAYYGGDNWYNQDVNLRQMVTESIDLANPTTDFSIFDNDGDGTIDVVIVLYAGVGQASSGVTDAVWPCQWELASAKTVDGVKAKKFAVFNEINGSYRNRIDGPGTFCHEFSHCLGLPDFYDTQYGGHFGMDAWSLMDYGCYNDDGYTPIGYSVYEKAFMGWQTITEGKPHTQYHLPVLNNADDPQSQAVILVNDKDNKEYFIFENRARQGWDTYINADGMMITHVTYNAGSWDSNTVNNYSLQRMTIVPADNSCSSNNLSGDLWPGANSHEFTDTSSPASTTNTGGYLSKPVTEITRNSQTGVVSFWVDRSAVIGLDAVELADPVVEESGSFTASWSAVESEDSEVTYTLQYWPKPDGIPAPEVWQNFENPDKGDLTWTASGYTQENKENLVLGSSSSNGSIQSPASIEPDKGCITVVTKAKSYATDLGCQIEISILSAFGDVVSSEIIATPKANTAAYHSVVFDNLAADAKYSVKIANIGNKRRVMIYNAMAFSGAYGDCTPEEYQAALEQVSSGAPQRAEDIDVSASGRVTISGITDTTYKVTDLTAPTYLFRVKAVPVDPEYVSESAWSTAKEVNVIDTTPGSGIETVATQARADYRIVDHELFATPGARLFNASGAEIRPVAPGRFAPAPGVYILVTPNLAPAKVIL